VFNADADIMEWVMLIENLRTLKAQCDRMAEIEDPRIERQHLPR
jgi:hypothetical protein